MTFQRFFVGGYTAPSTPVHPQGVSTCELDLRSGAMRVRHTFADVVNPSYLTHRDTRLFAVKETSAAETPTVSSFQVGEAGALTPIDSAEVPGDAPCHLSLDPSGRWLVAVTYGSGHVGLYAAQPEGTLHPRQLLQHEDRSGQGRAPHAHQAVFGPDGQLFVTDLGLDEVRRYRFDAEKGHLEPETFISLPPGSGPRHLAFHPSGRHAFVLGELDSSLSLFRYHDGQLERLQTVSLLADPSQRGAAAAVRVAPSGRFVYASHRDTEGQGNAGIAVFAFDEARERLVRTAFFPSGGRLPRDFALTPDGRLLLAAHQDNDRLVSFWVDTEDGRLEPTGEGLELHQPVCILMA